MLLVRIDHEIHARQELHFYIRQGEYLYPLTSNTILDFLRQNEQKLSFQLLRDNQETRLILRMVCDSLLDSKLCIVIRHSFKLRYETKN